MSCNPSPDLTFHNGRKTTLDPKSPEATNLAIKVAILQNVLAGRDPQLAILYTLVVATLALMRGGRFSLDARLESRWLQAIPEHT